MPRQKDPDAGRAITVRIRPSLIKRAKKLVTKELKFNTVLCGAVKRGLDSIEKEQAKRRKR